MGVNALEAIVAAVNADTTAFFKSKDGLTLFIFDSKGK